jgi:hypothetical protein
MKKKIFFLCLFGFICISVQPTAYASFLGGLGKTVFAPLEIPKAMLQQSRNFPFGLITGALSGTYNTVAGVASGMGEMAQGAASGAVSAAQTAAPYAKYAWIPLVL